MRTKSFLPSTLPLDKIAWDSFIDILGEAHAVLGNYNTLLQLLKTPRSALLRLTLREAYTSSYPLKSKITFGDLLRHVATKKEKWQDLQKVLHYQRALEEGARFVKTHAINKALLCKLHALIYEDCVSSTQEIGRFRRKQNWIGPEGCKMEEAYFYPPKPELLPSLLKNLEMFFCEKQPDPLVQLAIGIGQLLIIHPFIDGNGRVARILIPLFLYKKKILSQPLFYLSSYFRKHRLQYIHHLFDITAKKDWEGWIRFFLRAIFEQGKEDCKYLQKALLPS